MNRFSIRSSVQVVLLVLTLFLLISLGGSWCVGCVWFFFFFFSHLPYFFPLTCLDHACHSMTFIVHLHRAMRCHASRGTLLLLSALLHLSHKEACFLQPFRLGSCPFCPCLAADIPLSAMCSRSHQTSSFEAPLPPTSTLLLKLPPVWDKHFCAPFPTHWQ